MTRKLFVVANRNDKSSFVEEGPAPSNAFTGGPRIRSGRNLGNVRSSINKLGRT